MAIQVKFQDTTFRVGDTVKVYQQFTSGEKKQTQAFEGLVISIRGRGMSKNFTVRKIASDSIGVEKIWPINSPNLKKIEIKKKGNTRRAKLYYLRDRIGKEALKVKSS